MTDTTIVTGVAGFIGSQLAERLLREGRSVLGVDCLSDEGGLKGERLARLQAQKGFEFRRLDLSDPEATQELFRGAAGLPVIHLAARSGVRRAQAEPYPYLRDNLLAFGNILEACRSYRCPHLVFASSSAVYGDEQEPQAPQSRADRPRSLYAATKRANELMAHAYASLYALPCTAIRLFTVYGPWGRTDMAPYLFTRAILEGRAIDVFGEPRRDLTYIEDAVEGLLRALERPPAPATLRIYNVGTGHSTGILELIEKIEGYLGRRVPKNLLSPHPSDMNATCADLSDTERDLGFRPKVPLEVGLPRYLEWFLEYYGER